MRPRIAVVLSLALAAVAPLSSAGQTAPDAGLLPHEVVGALAGELSGEAALRNLEFLTRHHRMRGSRGYLAAAEHIANELLSYGLGDAVIERFPADGTTFYGTQKARPAWDATFAELWEVRGHGDAAVRVRRLASWDTQPITLAQDSDSADVVAELVDVGAGTSEQDYAGKDVRGKIVLASQQPGAVATLAVDRFGAAGIVSYAPNQRTAWWKEDDNLVRWGHLDSFSSRRTFGFMVSLKEARALQTRLAAGERVLLDATVRAARYPGEYHVVTATIPGGDPVLRNEEIVFSCHLDHQRPGANDNASGCVAILEVARTLSKLIAEERIPRPARTLRFIWPPEIEGTVVLLNARPEMPARMRAVVHMDMVGGGPETKAIFHVTAGPGSLPSFTYDVGHAWGAWVNQQTDAFASGSDIAFPLHAPEGGKEALQAVLADFSTGSDHQVYTEGSYRIPAVYLNDWPDRYIHTNFDRPENIDPTKLKRAAFIGAATALVLASPSVEGARRVWSAVRRGSLRRTSVTLDRIGSAAPEERASIARFHLWRETEVVGSMSGLLPVPTDVREDAETLLARTRDLLGGTPEDAERARGAGAAVYRRRPDPKGPMSVFGYDYLADHLGADRTGALGLLRFQGERGGGGEYAYEVLNFVDGRRTVRDIRDVVSAVYGPVPEQLVAEYLEALAEIGVLEGGLP